MAKYARKTMTILLTAVFLLSTFLFLHQQADKSAGSSAYEKALEIAVSGTASDTKKEIPSDPLSDMEAPESAWIPVPAEKEDPHAAALAEIDLEALRQVNPHVIGWILIPDTQVNYPLLQGEDNDYYLNRTWDEKSNAVGSIFLEYLNSPDLTDFNSIVYGHNMNNGSMFAGIRNYRDQKFWETHPYVYIRGADQVFRYEIFSSYLARTDSITYGLRFDEPQTRSSFLGEAARQSVIATGIEPEATDRILTLSTCSGNGYTTRWVVHARLKMVLTEV